MSSRKRQAFITGLIGLTILTAASDASAASRITSIDFKGTADPHLIQIHADGPLTYEKIASGQADEKQVIIEVRDATLIKSAARKIDTSSFNSRVALISPYQVQGQADTVRVVIQLREQAPTDVTGQGNVITVAVPAPSGSPAKRAGNGSESNGTASDSASDSMTSAPTPPASASSEPQLATPASESPVAASEKSRLDQFIDNRGAHRFTGRPITLQMRDVEAADAFRMIGEASGFNIIFGDDVRGKVTLSLVDVPWDQALDILLKTLHLGAERNNNVLRIVTLQNLTTEKTQELAAAQAAQASAPRITRIFPISYANLLDLQAILTRFASSAPGAAGDPNQAAIVQVDNRTNSLIVRDLPDNLDRMQKLVELLDTQTPQVMIEAKVVEATEIFSKNISGNLGFGSRDMATMDLPFFASFAGANPIDTFFTGSTPGVFNTGSDISRLTSSNGVQSGGFGVGYTPTVSIIPGLKLNALLNLGESESQVKVVSSPKTVVLNKETASIVQGTPVLVPGTTTVAGVGTVPTTSVVSANLSLNVQPTVTNDGSVLMRLTVARDVPVTLPGNQSGVGSRNINTIVLVESGTTLVIGGIYTMTSSKGASGFPFLRKIPILGALFGSETESTDRSELFIFITPRILNTREAGLNS